MPMLPRAHQENLGIATFVCRLNYINVLGALGRGEQFSDGFFITNDKQHVATLVPSISRQSIGNLEYDSILTGPLVAYKKISQLPVGAENTELIALLRVLDTFEDTLWLQQDNCFGNETAFIFRSGAVWSNTLGGMRSFADGVSQYAIEISADKFREVVRLFRGGLEPNRAATSQFHTKTNSSRISRTLNHIGRARKASLLPEKITFYCSALEAFLSTSQAELSHQIAERVAVISTNELDKRIRIYRLLKDCYSFRSKYIHGSVVKGELETIQRMSKDLDECVRNCIDAALTRVGFSAALKDEKSLDEYMIRAILGGLGNDASQSDILRKE